GGDVMVLYGDTPLIRPETLAALAEARRVQDAAVAVLGFRPADPGAYGRLKLDADGRLEAIVEFREATTEERAIGLCNSGVMCLDAAAALSILDRIGNDNAKG
ncbi:MAG TPA: bifunctional UDP-N-acetylglucosamine diphosphorylase/glucosamine-1-phosphate N-acetyltransferase GlmU, partial [Tistrella mobilis]|nr:bifunctional UDP-N-acetylglucosamine diphosphorylase/glucosamine-1-phosphate N-acetyltransferase GlmU [Tistrella mobilis]